MVAFFFTLILILINSKSLLEYENDNDLNILKCLDKTIETKKFLKEDLICFLYSFKTEPVPSCDYLNNLISGINNDTFKKLVPKDYFEENNITFLYDIIQDIIVNKSNKIIDNIFNIIKGSNSQMILNNLITILNSTNITYNYILKKLSQIFKVQEVTNLFHYTYQKYNKYFIDFLEFLARDTKYSNLLTILKNLLSEYKDDLKDLIYKLIQNYGNKNNITELLRDFFLETNKNNQSFLYKLEYLEGKYYIFKDISELINLDGPISDKIFKEILADKEIMNITLHLLQNNTF